MFQILGEDPEYDKQIMKAYNNTFTGGDGPIVIEHMLRELGFFDQSVPGEELSEADRVRQDYAKRILMWMGVWHEDNISYLVEAIGKLPVRLPETEDKENA